MMYYPIFVEEQIDFYAGVQNMLINIIISGDRKYI